MEATADVFNFAMHIIIIITTIMKGLVFQYVCDLGSEQALQYCPLLHSLYTVVQLILGDCYPSGMLVFVEVVQFLEVFVNQDFLEVHSEKLFLLSVQFTQLCYVARLLLTFPWTECSLALLPTPCSGDLVFMSCLPLKETVVILTVCDTFFPSACHCVSGWSIGSLGLHRWCTVKGI